MRAEIRILKTVPSVALQLLKFRYGHGRMQTVWRTNVKSERVNNENQFDNVGVCVRCCKRALTQVSYWRFMCSHESFSSGSPLLLSFIYTSACACVWYRRGSWEDDIFLDVVIFYGPAVFSVGCVLKEALLIVFVSYIYLILSVYSFVYA